MRSGVRTVLRVLAFGAALSCMGAAAAAPTVGDYGFDAAGMDPSVKPGDDFNAYANGAWIKATTIPGDKSNWGVWDVLDEQSRTDVRQILEEAGKTRAKAGSNRQKIGDYYASFMDEAAIEAKGAAPLKAQLDAVAAIRDVHGLADYMGRAGRSGDSMPVEFSVDADLKHPDVYAGYLEQGGLGLPDRDYYLQDDPKMAEARTAYLAYAAKLLRLSGLAASDADAAARAKAVFAAEKALAEAQWSRVQLRDVPARYKPWAQAEYAAKAPGLDWAGYFAGAGISGQTLLINSTDTALVGTGKVVQATPLAVWKDYLAIRAIDGHAKFLSKAFVDASFAFHSTALQGVPDQQDRWKRAARNTQSAMGEAVGQIYVQRHFTPQAKAAARELVQNLLLAMGRRLDAVDWMSPETRAKAREKLATFNPKIGYPDRWRDYSKLTVVRGDAYGNALAADRFEYDRNLAKLGKPVDRTEWIMTPMTINAYYNPTMNEIVFPAAVLQAPFFDPKADPAVNYGGIGAIIGHEISHGFDDQGRLFDAKGALTDWWTAEDAAKFKTRTDALVAQYGSYEALPGLKLNGALTLGENIADNAGLAVAYEAYHVSLKGKPAPVIDGMTGDQRFFLGFAQNWRTVWREQILRQITTTDPHSPDAVRVRTVRNFDPWYAAFDVKPGQAMYLPPAQRVHIW